MKKNDVGNCKVLCTCIRRESILIGARMRRWLKVSGTKCLKKWPLCGDVEEELGLSCCRGRQGETAVWGGGDCLAERTAWVKTPRREEKV